MVYFGLEKFLFLVWLVQIYRKNKNIGIVVLDILCLVGGGILSTTIVLLPFIVSGKLNYLIETAVTYNRYYIEFIGYGLNAFIAHNTKVFSVYWPFLILFGFYI